MRAAVCIAILMTTVGLPGVTFAQANASDIAARCGVAPSNPTSAGECAQTLFNQGLDAENHGDKRTALEDYEMVKQLNAGSHFIIGEAGRRADSIRRDLQPNAAPPPGDLPSGQYFSNALGPTTRLPGMAAGTGYHLQQSQTYLQVQGSRYAIGGASGAYRRTGDQIAFVSGPLAGWTGQVACLGRRLWFKATAPNGSAKSYSYSGGNVCR